ncbi:MAG: YIP1 family protein [Staphylococcus epidermidis]|nr:YIP1 family protein [Staphylococcus epidermidis]
MSTQELKENDIQNSSIPFVNHFNKLRHQPKWILKSIIVIVLAIISAFITYNTSNELLDNQSIANNQMDENMLRMSTTIGAFIGTIFSVVVVFLIFLIISKIFKSDAKASSLFSAALSYSIIILGFTTIISLIQIVFGLKITDYKLDSSKDNKTLMAFSLTNLLKAFLTGVVYYSTSRLSKKASVILGIVALIILIGSGMISGMNS